MDETLALLDYSRNEDRNDNRNDQTVVLRFSGHWTFQAKLPDLDTISLRLSNDKPQTIKLTAELQQWDSALVTALMRIIDEANKFSINVDRQGLPEGVQRLLTLAYTVPERKDAQQSARREPFLARIGNQTLVNMQGVEAILTFIGQANLALLRFVRGKARYRARDFWIVMEEVSVKALPIVTLISVLVGLILAFVGATQLQTFGAHIYVANLVGLGMAREMGAMMTGIIMAGRTGAAFAAQLGTMQVNQEIDALKTLGVNPMEFLVVPRMVALMLMVPLLTIYADLMGILGGAIVSMSLFDITWFEYYHQTQRALRLDDFLVGLIKGSVFGVLVALAGCLRGMQSGRSSAAVGLAATSAVVTAIVWIVVADAILTVVFNAIGL